MAGSKKKELRTGTEKQKLVLLRSYGLWRQSRGRKRVYIKVWKSTREAAAHRTGRVCLSNKTI